MVQSKGKTGNVHQTLYSREQRTKKIRIITY